MQFMLEFQYLNTMTYEYIQTLEDIFYEYIIVLYETS